ncbi:unnamed protein product [Adineta ricciae]|uniref:G-protein coupled receptors family 1 profile domain-containing protein n=1 Tax=Adineta ricciae TaxID=249248 RepID=A0A814XVL9_ADIRI|nr:unnamed protein product [Adineta ricciae]
MNPVDDVCRSYPLGYFINDLLTSLFNLTGITVAILFIHTVVRLEHPSYSIANLIACQTCLAIGLLSSMIFFNNCYVLYHEFFDQPVNNVFCVIRGPVFSVFYINMYATLCLKAFNRLRCVVYRIRSATKSCRSLFVLTSIQWIVVLVLVLPLVISNGIDYSQRSYLCTVTIRKPWQFLYLMIIYYISIVFITSAYIYILYYVLHLPLLEQYRRQRQTKLLRRILILLFMLTLPGIVYLILLTYWIIFKSIPSSSLKICTLIDSMAYAGAVATIFISNSRLCRLYCMKRQETFDPVRQRQLDLIVLQQPRRKVTIIQTSFTLEKLPINIQRK